MFMGYWRILEVEGGFGTILEVKGYWGDIGGLIEGGLLEVEGYWVRYWYWEDILEVEGYWEDILERLRGIGGKVEIVVLIGENIVQLI